MNLNNDSPNNKFANTLTYVQNPINILNNITIVNTATYAHSDNLDK